MKPIVIRSLGAITPLRPKAEAGTRQGEAQAAVIKAVVWRRKLRRLRGACFIVRFWTGLLLRKTKFSIF